MPIPFFQVNRKCTCNPLIHSSFPKLLSQSQTDAPSSNWTHVISRTTVQRVGGCQFEHLLSTFFLPTTACHACQVRGGRRKHRLARFNSWCDQVELMSTVQIQVILYDSFRVRYQPAASGKSASLKQNTGLCISFDLRNAYSINQQGFIKINPLDPAQRAVFVVGSSQIE